MTARRPRTRVLLGLTATVLVAIVAAATPIRPDVQKLLSEPQEPPAQFAPARAGWEGPEVAKASAAPPNPALETFGQAATVRAVREALLASAVPDWRALALIGLLIFLLRRLRRARPKARVPEPQPVELRPAA